MTTRKRREWGGSTTSAGAGASSIINKKSALSAAYAELGKELMSGKLRSVGTYTMGRPIGEGTYGKVRIGTHRLTGTRVAIKQVPKAHSSTLTREIHHHRRLHHPNIMQLYEVLATESCIWMVTELCAGGELYDYLVERGTMPEPEARRIFGQLCLSVAYIHDRGIVHRDLKLENVLLDEQCNVKLGDFGFTREFEAKKMMDTFCGTTGYAAPEMLAGRRYTGEEVDIWSLGVILYALLCGALPFDDDDEAVMKGKILHGEFELPDAVLSEESRDLVARILQQDPTARPAIKEILTHPWFTKSMPLVAGMETVDEGVADAEEGDGSPTLLNAKGSPLPTASPGRIDADDLAHKASSSNMSEATSFFSAKSKSDSEASDERSQKTDTTNPTTEGGDDDDDDIRHSDHPASESQHLQTIHPEALSLRHRNESQTTIKRQTSSGSEASRKASGPSSSKSVAATLPTHVESNGEPGSSEGGDGVFVPTMALSAPLEKRGSQSSSRGGHYRTPSRSKRRSSGGLSDHHPPSIDVKPIDYLALLQQSTPAIFSTVLEQNLLHQLSGLGMDVGQIVHSVVNEACDASGAMWWILKKKAEERAHNESEHGANSSFAYGVSHPSPPIAASGRARNDSNSSQQYAAALASLNSRASPTVPYRDLVRPTAVKAIAPSMRDAKTGPDDAEQEYNHLVEVNIPARDASILTHETYSTASAMSHATTSKVHTSKPVRPGEQRGRANSLGVRLTQVLAGKDKDARAKEGAEAGSIMIGTEHFALEDRSKSPVVGGLFAKRGDRGGSPSPTSTPRGEKKKDMRSPLRREAKQFDEKDGANTPKDRGSANSSLVATPSKQGSSSVIMATDGSLKPSKSVETFSTVSSSAHDGLGSAARKGKSGKSSFLHTVRNWLGTDVDKDTEKGAGKTKKKRKKQRSMHVGAGSGHSAGGTIKVSPSVYAAHTGGPSVGRSGSVRRLTQLPQPPPSAYTHGSASRSPRLSNQRGSLSRRSSAGSVQHPGLPVRPLSARRPSAGSITPTTTTMPLSVGEEYVLSFRGSRPSSAQSLHRPLGSATLHAKSGSTGSSNSFARMQSHGSGYSGSLRGIHARRPSVDGGTTVRRHRNYPHTQHPRHAQSDSGSRSRPSTPGRGTPFDDGSFDTVTPRRSLDSARASSPSATPRASQSVFVAHRSRTPYKPPSANPALLQTRAELAMGSDEREWMQGDDVGGASNGGHPHRLSYGGHHGHGQHHGPAFGTWRRSWGKPPPTWSGPVDLTLASSSASAQKNGEVDGAQALTSAAGAPSGDATDGKRPKLRDVFASRESDDDWEDEEEDEPTYAGGLGQLASSTWGADNLGPSLTPTVAASFGRGSSLASRFEGSLPSASVSQASQPASLMTSGRYAGVRSLFHAPSLGRETTPRTWVTATSAEKTSNVGCEDDGGKEGAATIGAGRSSPLPPPGLLSAASGATELAAPVIKDVAATSAPNSAIGSRIRSAAPTFMGPVTIEEEEEDE